MPALCMSEQQFFEFCQQNRDLRIERTAEGDLVVMPPVGLETGRRNAELNLQLSLWAKRNGAGQVFDSSTGFRLPNGAIRSPDAAWISNPRLAALHPENRQGFGPVCPDFVVELRSPTDRLEALQTKMVEYLENGARLGWLIDPSTRSVWVYRPNTAPALLEGPETLYGDPELPGFVLDLREIWREPLEDPAP